MNKAADKRFFCSALAQQLQEPLMATAGPKKLWVLLQDHSPWGLKAFDECGLSDEIKDYLRGLFGDQSPNIVLIRNSAQRQPKTKAIFIVHADEKLPRAYQYVWQHEQDLLDLPLVDAVNKTVEPNSTDALFLVCTNGKRDKCCAKYGMPLYKALKPSLGEQLWQSSHLGGDRFAANMVCLPYGILYGRMTPELATQAINLYQQGQLSLAGLRGRTCYSKPVQAAEYYVREHYNVTMLDALSLVSVEQNDMAFSIVFEADAKRFTVCLQQDFQQPARRLTCRAEEDSKVPVYRLQTLVDESIKG